jgi:hypothetical protein
VVLAAGASADNVSYTALSFVFAEVKRSKAKPWVVFTSEALWTDFTEESILHAATCQDRYRLTRKDLFGSHPAKSKPRIGRTAYQAFRGGENVDPHVWVLGVIKASRYLQVRAGRIKAEKYRDGEGRHSREFVGLSLVTPLVILDGLLYEAYLAGDEIEISAQEHLVYSCHYGSRSYPDMPHPVYIVTLDYLHQYLDEHQAWLKRMADFMRHHPKVLPKRVDLRESPIDEPTGSGGA